MCANVLTHFFPKSSNDFLVTPGRMVPVSGGVATSDSKGGNKEHLLSNFKKKSNSVQGKTKSLIFPETA